MPQRELRSATKTPRGTERRAASARAIERSRSHRQTIVETNQWDGEQRFGWTRETEEALFDGGQVDAASGVTVYPCSRSNGALYPRKRDLKRYKQAHPEIPDDEFDHISIDHDENYRDYITRTAGEAVITKDDAKAAYNDIDNLILVCQRKNSAKGNR